MCTGAYDAARAAEGAALRLVRSAVPGHAFHNHNGHVGDQVVHLVNLATVRALAAARSGGRSDGTGTEQAADDEQLLLSPHRFRANILIDGVAPWAELGWVGRRVQLGDEVVLDVECPTIRCPATQVDHATGQRYASPLAICSCWCLESAVLSGMYAVPVKAERASAPSRDVGEENVWPNFPAQAFPMETHAAQVLANGRVGSFVGIYAHVVRGGTLAPGQTIATQRPINLRRL
jgi:hypothetical protein